MNFEVNRSAVAKLSTEDYLEYLENFFFVNIESIRRTVISVLNTRLFNVRIFLFGKALQKETHTRETLRRRPRAAETQPRLVCRKTKKREKQNKKKRSRHGFGVFTKVSGNLPILVISITTI